MRYRAGVQLSAFQCFRVSAFLLSPMIISRTPYRISFFGGESPDLDPEKIASLCGILNAL